MKSRKDYRKPKQNRNNTGPSKSHKLEPKGKMVEGVVRVNSYGTGFIDDENTKDSPSIEVPTEYLHTATHGDRVSVKLTGKRGRKGGNEGEVVKITNKAKTGYAGVMINQGVGMALVADDRRLYTEILIPGINSKGAKAGDKAFVEIKEWTKDERNPIGEVVEVLGKHGDHEPEIRAILLEKGIARDFPHEVESEAKRIKINEGKISDDELAKRKDMRDTLTFTIDPADAKDFDDALSFKKISENKYEIGIHIADVSHFVREGTALDREARERGFSVYLVDRTIPMLPEVLSNDLCSLNPNEDKYAFSAIFEIDNKAHISKEWFGKTIINSDKRFSYEDAQRLIEKDPSLVSSEEQKLYPALKTLNDIAKIMRENKEKAGAIDFEQDEVKFELDDLGKPIRVVRKKRFDAHKLIEEFMLLANKEVARYMAKSLSTEKIGFLYRIHDKPDEERIGELAIFVRALGHELPISPKGVSVKDLQMLMKRVEGKAEESLIKTAAVRSMSKAVYSTDNIGHFGLAFEYYTHFTSPIRRYADLVVHRLLYKDLNKEPIEKGSWALYKKIALETSEKEIRAAEAERASIKFKQVEYMKERIGKVFDGVISGVTDWGIYVEDVETKSEGMVKLRDLGGDYYVLDKKNYAVVGEKTKKKYRLGDKVKFKVAGADVERKTLDYVLV